MKKNAAIECERVVIRFAGDSGDGMQLAGSLFSSTSALFGNDLTTFPDYPSEIRAPQGSVGGVSGFQIHVGHSEVNTPGDLADVLVAMNPAALKANRDVISRGGTIIIDTDSFTEKGLKKAGYLTDNPIVEDHLQDYHIVEAPIARLTKVSVKDMGFEHDTKAVYRSKNMFALGMVYWIFNRSLKHTIEFLKEKFKSNPGLIELNTTVLRAGYFYAETLESLRSYRVAPAEIDKGTYRNISGNLATAWGFLAASEKVGRELFIGSYPITPATEILQELSKRKDLGVKSFQAEDEIAGICTSIGASFAGDLAVTTTSGPGLSLKSEAIGLAVMTELPLVIVNVQRGGPSTGLPTKTEQSDLFQALYGRNGECPLIVIAASTPADCFHYAYMAAKLTIEHMTPVLLLTDGFIANGSEPWKIPSVASLPSITAPIVEADDKSWQPYKRNEETLSRYWAIPGTKGLEHHIGGLEKHHLKGSVSHDAKNHEEMVHTRAKKVELVANHIPDVKIVGDENAELLIVGWGGTYGHLYTAVRRMQEEGMSVALTQFNYINPLPNNTADVLGRFKKILVCELNLGQFADYLRMKHPEFKYEQLNKVQGLPFTINEIMDKSNTILKNI